MENTRPKRPIAGFAVIIVLALAVYALSFVEFPGTSLLQDYGSWIEQCKDGNILALICYSLSDFGDPTYQKTALGSVLMILGCIVMYYAGNKKSTFGVCYGTGALWPILISQLIASFGSVMLFRHVFEETTFIPSFIAIASFTPALVLLFGTEWYKILTAGIMGIFMGCPFAYWVNVNIISAYGLPGACAWVTPMILSGILAIEVCKVLPWMARQESDPTPAATTEAAAKTVYGLPAENVKMNDVWFVKRVFADFTEPTFFGNELAGFLFVVGGIIAVILNPAMPCYGDGNTYLVIIASQLLASGIGVFLYWHRWYELGFYNTFVPVASLTPAFVLFYGKDLYIVIVGAIVGAVFMPPIAEHVGAVMGKRYHGYIGSVVSMLLCCFMFIAIFNYVPGFGA